MSKKEKLFDLVRALDKQEKRYVGLFIRRNASGETGNYSLLFSAIAAQKEYDEKKIKAAVQGRTLHRTFAVTKHYLYNVVLKALAAYHVSGTVNRRLGEMILHAELLFEKKLHTQCLSVVKKAMVIARQHERNERLLELLDLELRCHHAMTQVREVKALNEKVLKEKEALLEEQLQLSRLQKLSFDNFIELKTRWVREEKKKSPTYTALLKWKDKDLRSARARILYHQILGAHCFSVNNLEQAYLQLMKLVGIFEKNPLLVNEHINQYIALLNNLNLLLFERNEYGHILSNIEKLRNIRTSSVERKARILERLINVELNVYKHTGEFEKGKAVLEEARTMLEHKKPGPVYRMLFLVDLCLYHFAFNDHRTSLHYLNLFMRESNVSLREDLQKTVRILNMILHYELGNYDYFDSLLRSSKRFFKKIAKLDAVEELFLNFFPKAIACTSAAERKSCFRELQHELSELEQQQLLQETYFQNFDLGAWARANSEGISFARAISEKYAQIRKNQ